MVLMLVYDDDFMLNDAALKSEQLCICRMTCVFRNLHMSLYHTTGSHHIAGKMCLENSQMTGSLSMCIYMNTWIGKVGNLV